MQPAGARRRRVTPRSRSGPTTRSSPRRRSCAGSREFSAAGEDRTRRGAASSRGWAVRTSCTAPSSTRRAAIDELCDDAADSGWPARRTPAPTRRSRRPIVRGGTKIERDPRSGRPRARRPHPARPERPSEALATARGARRPGRQGRDHLAHDDPSSESPVGTPLWDALDAMVQPVPPRAEPRAVLHRRRHRRPVLPPARVGRATASGCSRSG